VKFPSFQGLQDHTDLFLFLLFLFPFFFLNFRSLGQTFAYQECSYLLIRLLQHFDGISFAPDAQPEDSLPPEEWKSMEGRQALEKVRVKSSMTLYVEASPI
jgi:hypothetical protein